MWNLPFVLPKPKYFDLRVTPQIVIFAWIFWQGEGRGKRTDERSVENNLDSGEMCSLMLGSL